MFAFYTDPAELEKTIDHLQARLKRVEAELLTYQRGVASYEFHMNDEVYQVGGPH